MHATIRSEGFLANGSRRSLASVFWLCAFAAGAHAQATPDESAQPSARHGDAHADRVLIVPTAETQPEGTLFGSDYDIILPSVGYAPTDRVHVSLTGSTDGRSAFAELDLKANLLRSRFLRLAALSAIDYARGSGSAGFAFGRIGGTAQLCFELRCRASLSLHAMVVLHDEPDTVLPLGFGAGFIAPISRDVSALLEYSMLVDAARDLPLITFPIYLVGYGVRVSSQPSWALDIAFLRRMRSDTQVQLHAPSLFEFLGVPLLAFTLRGKP